MSRRLVKPQFPLPPQEYSQNYMSEVVRSFSLFLQKIENPGDSRFTTVTITNLPTNDVGLESGTIYNHDGFARVSQLDTSAVAGTSGTMSVGSVSVTTG